MLTSTLATSTEINQLASHLRDASLSTSALGGPSSAARHIMWDGALDASKRSPPMQDTNPAEALHKFIESLLDPDLSDSNPNLLAVGYELEALLAIHGEESTRLCASSRPASWDESGGIPSATDIMLEPGERIRYELSLPLFDEDNQGENGHVKIRVLVSLPPTYPNSSPPQLQLLGRYVGQFTIDAGLFGTVTRTYISSTGVAFTPGDVCVFEGLQHTLNICREWYTSRQTEGQEGDKARETERKRGKDGRAFESLHSDDEDPAEGERPTPTRATFSYTDNDTAEAQDMSLPESVVIHSSEPIVERRSSFQGHAVQLDDPRHVPLVIHQLLSDRKIAKATHPAIFAYRISQDKGGKAVIMSDNDDDGESAAGARLAHLLQILELENVLVVVSRWYGGILLGPERFKHINQAARDALELASLLGDKPDTRRSRR